jgi:hypothetical protein
MQQRLREARIESLARSVDRANGKRSLWSRLRPFGRAKAANARSNGSSNGTSKNGHRRGHAEMDFHDRGEDVWKALRD